MLMGINMIDAIAEVAGTFGTISKFHSAICQIGYMANRAFVKWLFTAHCFDGFMYAVPEDICVRPANYIFAPIG